MLVQRTCNEAPVASTSWLPVCSALSAVSTPGTVGYAVDFGW